MTIHNIGYQGVFGAADVGRSRSRRRRLSTAPGRSQGRAHQRAQARHPARRLRDHGEPDLRARDHHAALRHGHGAGAGGARQRRARHPERRRLRGMGSAPRPVPADPFRRRSEIVNARPSSSAISCCARTCRPTHGRVPLFGIVSRLTLAEGLRPAHRYAAADLLTNHDVRAGGRGHAAMPMLREILRRPGRTQSAAAHGFSPATTKRSRTGSRARATSSSCRRSTSPAVSTRCTACATARFPSCADRRPGRFGHAFRSGDRHRHRHRVQRFRRHRDELGAGYRDAVVSQTRRCGSASCRTPCAAISPGRRSATST